MGEVKIRDRYLGTRSNKLRRAPYIVDYLIQCLDCQEIRRLCRYFTLDPLADEALDYNGELVQQPDLRDSLEKRVIRDKDNISQGAEDKVLFAEAFSSTIIADNKVMIYVYPYEISFSERAMHYGTSTMGFMTFMVDIIYPISLNRLGDHLQRAWSIATILMDIVDEKTVLDPELYEYTGDVKFEIKDTMITNQKLTPNSDMAILRIPLTVSVPSLRTPSR